MNIDNTIICLFYNSVVSSVLTYAISVWFKGCSDSLVKDINKFNKKVCKLVRPEFHSQILDNEACYERKTLAMVDKIMKDSDHPFHHYFKWLNHDSRLNMLYCRTDRFKNTFIPSSIKLFNDARV